MRKVWPAHWIRALVSVLALLPLAAGCGANATKPARLPGGLSLESAAAGPVNGRPISLTLVRPGAMGAIYVPPGGHIYSLTYWSRGQRAQAYLDVPHGKGPFPLFVDLHGGYVFAEPGHSDLVYWNQEAALVNAQSGAVAFLPNYVGYGPSRGRVGDAYQDFLDVRHGLAALNYVAGLHLAPNATYVLGFSLGGVVGSLLAGEDHAVRAAAFVSPWAGAERSYKWYETNLGHLDESERLSLDTLVQAEGTNTESRWYRRNSYGCTDLHIPLLLIGGTKDDVVPAALLSATAIDLRQCGIAVELRFFSGGHAVYTAGVQALLQRWFLERGISLQL